MDLPVGAARLKAALLPMYAGVQTAFERAAYS